MKTLFIRSIKYLWKIIVFYLISSEELIEVLLYLLESLINNALLLDFILSSSIDSGVTYTCLNKRTTVVSINKCSSKELLINTIVHECVHIMQHLKQQDIIFSSEEEAIFISTLSLYIIEDLIF